MWALITVVAAADPLDDLLDDLDDDDAAPAPAPLPAGPAPGEAPAPAAATPPTSAVPAIQQLGGTWFVTSTIDGVEKVAWACTGHPTTIEVDSEVIVVNTGGEQLGGAVSSVSSRGDLLVVKTTLASCTGTDEVTARWADPAHRILEFTRCEGSPRKVRAVRDVAAGVPVVRQCCDPAGKAIKYVASDANCPSGYEGQKPTPLRR